MKINFFQFGKKGKAIVFLHGWQQSGASFSPLVPFLHSRYRLFLVDLPGFGKSELPPENYSSQDYAREIFRWAKKQQLEKFFLVGHSFGGKVAAVLAASYPQAVEKLVLIAPSGIPHPKWWYPLKERLPRLVQKMLAPILRRFLASRDYRQAGKMLPVFRNIVKEDLRPIFRKIQTPTLIIWGDQDQELPLADGQEIKKLIKNSRLEIIAGASHVPFLEQPERISRLLSEFLTDD